MADSTTSGASSNGTLTNYDNTIRLLGLNSQFDTKSMLDAEIQALQVKNVPYLNKVDMDTNEENYWKDLDVTKSDFYNAASALKMASFDAKNVDNSDTGSVSISAAASAIDGTYTLTVDQLAQKNKILGDAFASSQSALGYQGDIQIGGKTLSIKSTMTLTDIANAINQGGYSVNAVILANRIMLTSKEEGAANNIQLTDSTNGESVTSTNGESVTSSNQDQVSATITGGVTEADHQVTVSQLAAAQKVESNMVNKTDKLGVTGTFTLGGATFNVTDGQTWQDVVSEINANKTLGIQASITTDGKVVLTGKTGAANAFTLTDTSGIFAKAGMVGADGQFTNQTSTAQDASYTIDGTSYTNDTNTATNISGVSLALKSVTTDPITVSVKTSGVYLLQSLGFLNTDGTIKSTVQQGQDAKYTLEGIQMTSSSNHVTTGMAGVTFDFNKQTTSPVTFSVKENLDDLKSKVSDFVTKYNALVTKINQDTAKGAVLQGKTMPNEIKRYMNTLLDAKTDSSLFMFQVGIQLDGDAKDGTIKFDPNKLDSMLGTNRDEVMKLLTGVNSVSSQINDKINQYDPQSEVTNLEAQITDLNKTIDDNNQSFQKIQQSLIDKYTKFETQMASLNTESDYMDAQLSAMSGTSKG